jgi:hypothetical protein
MSTDLEVRFVGGERVREVLAEPAPRERVLFGLANISSPASALIVREAVEVPATAFVNEYESTWSHRFTMEQVDRAAAAGTGLCIVHGHAGRGAPRLSGTDRTSFNAIAPAIQSLHPTMPIASVVLSTDWHAAGRVAPGGGRPMRALSGARWFTSYIEIAPLAAPVPGAWQRGTRHLAVWGRAGEGRVRAARIGVVGLGGGGSHIVQQLAHVCVRELVGVDADLLEEHNRSRVVGTERGDIGKKKLRAMKRLVKKASDGHTTFTAIDGEFPGVETLAALATCDIIVGCVDKLHTRKLLQDFAWQHAIPLVDIGLTIVPTEVPNRPRIGGNVFIGIPGGACMWCAGILTQSRLEAEKDANGYVRGGGEAQVVSLNGTLASQGVTEVLNLLTGFLSAGERPPAKLIFDGRQVMSVECKSKPGCDVCRSVGFGDVVWQRAA